MSSEALLKYLAVIFLFIVMCGSFGVAVFETVNNQPVSTYAIGLLGTGLGYAMTAAGVVHGSSIVQTSQQTSQQTTTSIVDAMKNK